MVNYCRVIGCHNRSRRLWLARLGQDFNGKNLKNIRVCSDHFINRKKADLYGKDNPDWAPSVNMGTNPLSATPEVMHDRYQRRTQRNQKSEAARTLVMFTEQFSSEVRATTETESETIEIPDKSCQTDIDGPLLDAKDIELQRLRTENIQLKDKLKNVNPYSLSSFEGNDEKVKFFTGLPCFTILMTLFNFLEPFLPVKQSLDKFECFTMTHKDYV